MSTSSTFQHYSTPPMQAGACVVYFDGLPEIVTDRPEAYLHAVQGQSIDYATTHGGWSIRRPNDGIVPVFTDADTRGAHAFITMGTRRGYGVQGLAVRLMLQLRDLVNTADVLPDYVLTGDVVEPLAKAAIGANQYLDGDAAAIRGELDSAVRALAIRGGLTSDQAAAL